MKLIAASVAFVALIQAPPSPQSAVDELLAADRRFAADAAKHGDSALSAMLAEDGHAHSWTAAGVCAQEILSRRSVEEEPRQRTGQPGMGAGARRCFCGRPTRIHGRLHDAHQARRERGADQYVAYWVKKPEGWRVAVYKRVTSELAAAAREMMPPALPPARPANLRRVGDCAAQSVARGRRARLFGRH